MFWTQFFIWLQYLGKAEKKEVQHKSRTFLSEACHVLDCSLSGASERQECRRPPNITIPSCGKLAPISQENTNKVTFIQTSVPMCVTEDSTCFQNANKKAPSCKLSKKRGWPRARSSKRLVATNPVTADSPAAGRISLKQHHSWRPQLQPSQLSLWQAVMEVWKQNASMRQNKTEEHHPDWPKRLKPQRKTVTLRQT